MKKIVKEYFDDLELEGVRGEHKEKPEKRGKDEGDKDE